MTRSRLPGYGYTSGLFDGGTLPKAFERRPRTLMMQGAIAAPCINTDAWDTVVLSGLSVAITSMTTNLQGSPGNTQRLLMRMTDDGTSQSITWGAGFMSSGIATLPTATPAGKTMTLGFIYDTTAAAWVLLALDSTGYTA